MSHVQLSSRCQSEQSHFAVPTASLPGDPYERRHLYVRACYHQLFDIIATLRAVLLIGTPGIGKAGTHSSNTRHEGTRRLSAASCLLTGCLTAVHHVFDMRPRACLQSWFLLYIIWRLQQEGTPPVIVW